MRSPAPTIRLDRLLLCSGLAVWLAAFGCASNSGRGDARNLELSGAPGWVVEDCRDYLGRPKPAWLCGVGSFKGSSNISLARTAAMARGRTEIARSLDLKVRSMLEDYQATAAGRSELGVGTGDTQHVIDMSKHITDVSLTGTKIHDTCISNSGTYYTLMVLDVERFEQSVSGMQRLSEGVRRAITERAEAAFAVLDEE